MTIEYRGPAPQDWSPIPGSIEGENLPVVWPLRGDLFYTIHKNFFFGSPYEDYLQQHLFAHQLPLGGSDVARGHDLSSRLGKDINSTLHAISVQTELFGVTRDGIQNKIRRYSRGEIPAIRLTDAESFGLLGQTQAIVSGITSYLDLLGKYLYVVLFDSVQGIDSSTGHRKRSYFRELRKVFYNLEDVTARDNCPILARVFINHHGWIERAHKIRDFFQHAGAPNPLLWRRGNEALIDFTGGTHNFPLPQSAFLATADLSTVVEGINNFNNDVLRTLRTIFLESHKTGNRSVGFE